MKKQEEVIQQSGALIQEGLTPLLWNLMNKQQASRVI